MRVLLITFFCLSYGASVFAETADEKEERQRRFLRERRINKQNYKVDNGSSCSDAKKNVAKIQSLLSSIKGGEKGKEASLFKLEQEYEKKRAEKVILNGIKELNTRIKDIIKIILYIFF